MKRRAFAGTDIPVDFGNIVRVAVHLLPAVYEMQRVTVFFNVYLIQATSAVGFHTGADETDNPDWLANPALM